MEKAKNNKKLNFFLRLLLGVIITVVAIPALLVAAVVSYYYITGSRRYIESKFRSIGTIYPTETLEELFEKMPNGGEIYAGVGKKDGEDLYNYLFSLSVDSSKKYISGTYKKIRGVKNGEAEVVEELEVAYNEEKGMYAVDGREVEEWMKDMKFVFQLLDLRKEKLKKYKAIELVYAEEGKYKRLQYQIEDEKLREYMDIPKERSLTVELHKGDYNSKSLGGIEVYSSSSADKDRERENFVTLYERVTKY